MTRIRVEDLPAKLRKQVEAAAADPATTHTPPRRRGSHADPGPRYRCGSCGELFDRYGAAIERHADQHGGARLEALLR